MKIFTKLLSALNIENKSGLIPAAIYLPQPGIISKKRKRFTLPLLRPVVFSLKQSLFLITALILISWSGKVNAQTAPAISYTTPNTFVYGTAIATLTPTNSGGVPDTYSISPALPSGLSFDAGTGTISGTPATIAAAADYTVTATNINGSGTFAINITVNPASLTVTANSQSKTYGTAFSFAGTEFTTSGLLNSDAVSSVTLTSAGAAATAAVAGSPYSIVPSAATGSGLSNYTITYVNGSMTVNTAALTITAKPQSKTYGTTFSFAGTEFNTSGLLNSDAVSSVTLTSAGAAATAAVAGSPYTIVPSAATGSGLSNYTITYVNGSMTVNTAALTLTGLTPGNKVYDGTTTVTSFTGGTLNGVLAGDAVTFTASGTFATKNVGTGIAVTSTTTLGGPQGANYTLTQPAGLTANITAKTLTLTNPNLAAANKVYDATNAATITGTLSGIVGSDAVTLVGTGTFASKNVGTGIAVTSTSTLTGAQATNYTLTQPTGLTANITPFTLSFTFSPVHPNKTYDGTTAATIGSATINVFAADAANVTLGGTPVGTFNSASVGNGKTVTITGYTISGTAIGNYTLNQPTIGGVQINPAPLTITANDVSKIYGTTLTTPVPGSTAFTPAGLVNGETIGSVTINYGAARAAATAVGTYSGQVTITSNSASGGTFTASNYSITLKSGAIIVGSAPFDWTGATNSDWATPGNWTSAGIVQTTNYPGKLSTTDVANIGVNNSFTNNPNIAANLPNSLGGINFGTGPGTINLTLTSGVTLAVGGNFTLSAGTETVNMIATNPTLTIGGNYSATSGTTFNWGGSNPMTITGTTTNAGTFNQSGTGLVTVTGTTSNSGTINQTSTGNIVFTGDFTNSGSSSALKQTGTGSLTFSGNLTNAGTFTQGGGIVSVAGALTNTGTLNVGTSTFTVTGDFTNNGTYTQGTGTIVFNNPKIQFLYDASPSGTIFTNVNINNGPNTKIQTGNFGIASTGVLTLSATPGNVTKVTVVSSLTLYSDANSTATVAAICSTCTVNGNVTVQRYLSGQRGYRLIASPVNSATVGSNSVYSLNYVKNAAYITGTSASGGFDKVQPGATLYLYREDVPVLNSTFIDGNYQAINNLNNGTSTPPTYTFDYTSTTGSYSIPVSNGFLFFFRGNRKDGLVSDETKTTWPATTATLSTTGALNQNQVVFRDWYTPTSTTLGYTSGQDVAAQGFNLAGNPYASSIDWDTYNTTTTTSGIYTQNLSQFVYELNPNTENYDVYKAGSATSGTIVNTNHGSRTIVSGQGFFVLALNTSAQLIFNESAKVNTQVPINVGGGNTNPALMMAAKFAKDQHLRLQLAKDTVNKDDILIQFDPGSKSTFDINEDAPHKAGAGKVSLSSFSADHINLAINQLPLAPRGDTIRLKVNATTGGTYTLNMKDIKGIPQLYDIWLKDAFTQSSVNMRDSSTYSFTINTADTTTFGANRFTLALVQNPAFAYKLLSFDGQKTGKHAVQLTWNTQNEQNYTNFTVERSNDNGKTYNAIGGMISSGQGTYSLPDPDPMKGDNLYRLKSTDFNNTVTYSNVVDEQFQDNGNNKSSRLSLYPNPAVNTINLAIVPKSQGNTTYDIRISNSAGMVVKSATVSDVNWQNNVSNLLTGTYLIEVVDKKDNSIVGQTKFVKL